MGTIDSSRKQLAFLSLALFALFVFTIVRLTGQVDPVFPFFILGNPSGLACSYRCLGPTLFLSFLGGTGQIALLAFLGFDALRAVIKTCLRAVRTRRFLRRIRGRAIRTPGLPGWPGVVVFHDRLPLAFTGGFIKPTIYISDSLQGSFSPAELEAVWLHESAHKKARDPLRSLLAGFFGDLYFFLPIAAFLKKTDELLAEVRADTRAIRAPGHVGNLAGALLKAQKIAGPSSSWFSDLRPERAWYLSGKKINLRPPRVRMLISASVLILLVLLALRPGTPAADRAFAFHQKSCPEYVLQE